MSYPGYPGSGYPNQGSGYPPYQQEPLYPPPNQQPMGFDQFPQQPNQLPYPQNHPYPTPPFPAYPNPMNPPFAQNQSFVPYPSCPDPMMGQVYPPQVYEPQAYPSQAHQSQAYPNLPNSSQQQPTQVMQNVAVPAITLTPTARPAQPFYPQQDAEVLRKAMKGFGTDEKAIISILANRSNQQRMEINNQFKVLFGKDLISELKSEIGGKFEDLVVASMTYLPEFLCRELHLAIDGTGTDEGALIEILCSLDNMMMRTITAFYQQLYQKSLESDIKGDTSGHFERLLVSLCQGRRDETPTVNMPGAVADAQALLQAGAGQVGTDESTFNMVMASRSYPQLRQIFVEYQKIASGKTIEQAIKSEFSGDIMNAHLAIVKCAQSTPEYFAERLYDSIQGMGTKDKALIRLVTWRSEVDMGDIKTAFQSKYNKSLESFIQGDTSGDYKNMLIAMIN